MSTKAKVLPQSSSLAATSSSIKRPPSHLERSLSSNSKNSSSKGCVPTNANSSLGATKDLEAYLSLKKNTASNNGGQFYTFKDEDDQVERSLSPPQREKEKPTVDSRKIR
jgi:hypothetical protein